LDDDISFWFRVKNHGTFSMSKLHIDSMTKSFGQKEILKDIYLHLETGKICGILGRNGAGKSTLMQMIFGNLRGNTQFIKYNDKVLQTQFDRKNRIAYLPQHPFLPRTLKIKTLIDLFCDNEQDAEISGLYFIQPLLNQTVQNLSSGEIRLIETLLIIYSKAEFIILDEPFHSLSPKMISYLKQIIKNETKTIISILRFWKFPLKFICSIKVI